MVASSLFWHHAVMPVSLKPSLQSCRMPMLFLCPGKQQLQSMVDGLMDDIVEPDDVVIGGPYGELITESSG